MPENFYLYIMIGFIAMIAGGFWGLGGGWYIMPSLLLLGVKFEIAATASLMQVAGSTFMTVASQAHSLGWKKGDMGLMVALPLCCMSFIGGLFGAPLNNLVAKFTDLEVTSNILFMIIMMWIFWKSLQAKKQRHQDQNFQPKLIYTCTTGFFTGMLAAFLGIGGGTIKRPMLTNVLKVPEMATGKICRLAVFQTTLAGTISKVLNYGIGSEQTQTCFNLAVLLFAGGIIGYSLGAKIHTLTVKADNEHLVNKSFSIIAFLVLLSLLAKFFGYIIVGQKIMIISGILVALYLLFMLVMAIRKLKMQTEITEAE